MQNAKIHCIKDYTVAMLIVWLVSELCNMLTVVQKQTLYGKV